MRLQEARESFTCDYCGDVYLPEKNDDGVRVLETVSDTLCPVCQVPLAQAAMLSERFLYCTSCRGTLIPMPVFVTLVAELRARGTGAASIQRPPDRRELDRGIRCPRCGGRMDAHFYAGGGNVIIDDCSRCELNWLDAGELQAIGRAPDHFPEQSEFTDRF